MPKQPDKESDLAARALDELMALPRPRSRDVPAGPPPPQPTQPPQPAPASPAPAAVPAASQAPAYLGDGLYRTRSKGLRKKLAIYMSPEAASALRLAAATGEDRRGPTMGDIVEALLRENHYL